MMSLLHWKTRYAALLICQSMREADQDRSWLERHDQGATACSSTYDIINIKQLIKGNSEFILVAWLPL